MLKTKHILLASHDTPGARAAEKIALTLCPSKGSLTHLIVVPDFWKGMMGDDWLNNASTRDIYGKYVEGQLENDVRRHIKRIMREAAKRKLRYQFEVVVGKPTECLIKRAKKKPVDLVVLGSHRPKNKEGLRSRMLDDEIFRSLNIPVLVVPYPHG